jgi:hypothetical protein
MQEEDYEPPRHEFKQVPSSMPGWVPPETTAPDAEVRKAADILNAGSRVAMLIGQGARTAAAEVIEVAELTGAGIAKALLGKDVLPDDLPYVTGAIGLLGTRPSYELMRDCDTLLIVGSNFPYTQFLPEFGQARGVQIDVDGKLIGMRYPTEVNLVGDAKATLRALLPLLQRKSDRSWRETVERNVVDWWETLERRALVDADPINPMRIFSELSSRLPDNAIITSDSGSAANWYARHLKLRAAMRGSPSGTLATMGPGVPYAIGAKFGHPDRPAIALVGDGAMQMNGLNELITIRRYYQGWTDPRLIVAVLQQRPEPGDVGAARDGRRAQVRGVADTAGGVVRGVRTVDRAGGRRGREAGADRPGLGPRARGDGAGRARRTLRSGYPADPAAYDVRGAQGHRRGGDQGRPGRTRDRHQGAQDQGPGVPARPRRRGLSTSPHGAGSPQAAIATAAA